MHSVRKCDANSHENEDKDIQFRVFVQTLLNSKTQAGPRPK